MSGFSWVTLATNDSYSLGALVLAHSLKRVGTAHQLVVMVTPGVTQSMREKLRNIYDLVFEVNILDSKDERNLLLLQRPELGITFTKLHCWRLTQYNKCVFLDADTLVLQNCDELFDREEFSAAPDVGWPDCFNSGVFVYKPSDETFNSLLAFALERGSFDGGDQGLLNLYFSDWAHKDISKHLPFIYNMCSTACYSYLPAFKQFGENVKIIHFIGNSKPWLQYFNSETLHVSCNPGFEHMQLIFEHWWNLFCTHVHSGLQPTMARINTNTPIASSCTSSSHSFAYYINESKCEDSLCTEQFYDTDNDIPVWDPWENYQPVDSSENKSTECLVDSSEYKSTDIPVVDNSNIQPNPSSYYVENVQNNIQPTFHESSSYSTHSNQSSNVHVEYFNNVQQESHVNNDNTQKYEQVEHVNIACEPPPNFVHSQKQLPAQNIPAYQSVTSTVLCDVNSASTITVTTEPATHASNTEPRTESNGGLAGAFAQMNLRQPRSASQNALEDHLRRQGWEAGRIDYLGQDSFDNVWKKICETLAGGPKKEPSPPKEDFEPAVVRAVIIPPIEPTAESASAPAAVAEIPELASAPASQSVAVVADIASVPEVTPNGASESAPVLVRGAVPVFEPAVVRSTPLTPEGAVPAPDFTTVSADASATVSSPVLVPAASEVQTAVESAVVADVSELAAEAAVVRTSISESEEAAVVRTSISESDPDIVSPAVIPDSIVATTPAVIPDSVVVASPAVIPDSIVAATAAVIPDSVVVASPAVIPDSIVAATPAVIPDSVVVASPAVIPDSIIAATPAVVSDSVVVASPTVVPDSVVVASPAVIPDSAVPAAPAVIPESVVTAEPSAVPEPTAAAAVVHVASAPVAESAAPVATPLTEPKPEASKETKAVDVQKQAKSAVVKTEEQKPAEKEKSASTAEEKKEAVKPVEGPSSEPTPVPPPRKSGKNGGATAKKTTKKK